MEHIDTHTVEQADETPAPGVIIHEAVEVTYVDYAQPGQKKHVREYYEGFDPLHSGV